MSDQNFSIGDVAEETGLTVDTLRFYEKSEVIGPIHRKHGGRRSYTKKDLDWLDFVTCLKSTGMSLDSIREYRKLMMEGDETAAKRKELMIQHRESLEQQMATLQEAMDRINYKIDFYDEILNSKSHNL